jgi:NAD(P)-dependent dehydrogenase (short-subunit alcohol dehydrogenase family)
VVTPIVAAAGLTDEFWDGMSRQAPMGRWIHAVEVAEATVFLSSSRAQLLQA